MAATHNNVAMITHLLYVVKGLNIETGRQDIIVKPKSSVDLTTVVEGIVMSREAPSGDAVLGVGKKHRMPLYVLGNATKRTDIAGVSSGVPGTDNLVSVGMGAGQAFNPADLDRESTDAWSMGIPCVVAVGGFELMTTEFTDQEFAPEDWLYSLLTTAEAGKVKPLPIVVPNVETIVGKVSLPATATGHFKNAGVQFWTVFREGDNN